MEKNIFISHSSYDKEIVRLLADLIKKVSLNQIHIWFSNDTDAGGGFLIGEDWFDSIITNLKKSHVVISFITQNSNNQPWILYESGFAEALNNCVLVPVKFNINVGDVSVPLQHKQIYNLSGLEDVNTFLSKLLDLFDIMYDREVFQGIVQRYLKKMRDSYEFEERNKQESNISNQIIERVEQKLDYYLSNVKKCNIEKYFDKYEVILLYKIGKTEKQEYITINQNSTVQDILDEIYYIISDVVRAYTYLESWVLLEKKSQRVAIISEDIYDWIPAQSIFKINTLWEVKFLKKPLIKK